ncbi:hypothetical protein [Pseudomonas sp. 58 R 3]|uniref:hypothetical protein n=1 Tax=Pseudomonas sp. 58 R 3 TaxID=1844108 RepID=UPI001111D407|nr:hypothetical protein [Pseudomonas sp. 58 R 3]
MAKELMTEAVCWDMDAKVSARFAHSDRALFYFCECCLEEVVASISQRDNFFFKALNSHKPGCAHEKEKTQASDVPVQLTPRTAHIAPPLIPSHLGKLTKRRKSAKPSQAQMQALVAQVSEAPAMHPGTLAEVVDAWSAMSVSQRHRAPLSIAGRQLAYFDAFAQMNASQKNIALLECDQKVIYAQATATVLDKAILVVTWLKFETANKPVPIRVKIKPTDPVAEGWTSGQHVRLFLHGPVPALNAQQTHFEMQPSTDYSGFIVRP